ncbi:hypothetical protein BJ742DRAFT_854468 [Cladochytrium replicatum]|nr:hypothetical protein BJ742DRAFT_854468 [Cladochytrium replicatum]
MASSHAAPGRLHDLSWSRKGHLILAQWQRRLNQYIEIGLSLLCCLTISSRSLKKKAIHPAATIPSPIRPATETRHFSIKENPLPSPGSENIPTVQTPVSLETVSHISKQSKPHDAVAASPSVPTRTHSEPAPFRASDVATVTQELYDDLLNRFHDVQEKCNAFEESNRLLTRSLVETQAAANRVAELDARARSVELQAENIQLKTFIRNEGYANSDARSQVSPRSMSPLSTIPHANIDTDNAREGKGDAARLGMISEDLDTARAGAHADLEELLQERARGDEERARGDEERCEIELAIEETERVRGLWASDKLRFETEMAELRHRLQTAVDACSEKVNLSAGLEAELEAHHKASNAERERLEAELQIALADKRRLEADLSTVNEHIEVLASKVQSFVDNERLMEDKIADLESRSVAGATAQIPAALDNDCSLIAQKENAVHLSEVIAGQRSVVGLLDMKAQAQAKASNVPKDTHPSQNNVMYAEAIAGQNSISASMTQPRTCTCRINHQGQQGTESVIPRSREHRSIRQAEKRLQLQLSQQPAASGNVEVRKLTALSVANAEAMAGQQAQGKLTYMSLAVPTATTAPESEKASALNDRGQRNTISQLASFVGEAVESRKGIPIVESGDAVTPNGVIPHGGNWEEVSSMQERAIRSAEVAAGQQYLITALTEWRDAFVAAAPAAV